jgi:hypothetical protein
LLKAENSISADKDRMIEDLARDTDYETMPQRIGEATDKLKNKYEEIYGNDPEIWNAVEPHINSKMEEVKHMATMKGIQLLNQDGQAKLDVRVEKYSQEIAQAPTPEYREALMNDADAVIQKSVSNHIITPAQGFKKQQDLRVGVEKTEVINAHRSSDLAEKDRVLNMIDNHEFKVLEGSEAGQVWLANTKGSIEKSREELQTKMDKKADELSVNHSIASLEKDWTNPTDRRMDFDSVMKELNTDQFRKDHGLLDENGNPDRKRIEEVSNYFRGRQAEQDKLQTKEQKQYNGDIADAFAKGNFTQVHKMVVGAGDRLTAEQKESWTKTIEHEAREARSERREIRTEERQKNQDKSDAIFGDIANKIANNQISDPTVDIYGQIPKGLKAEKANLLHSMWKQDVDPNFRLGVDVINDAYNATKDPVARGKAIQDLRSAMQKDNLKGKAIIDKANEIAHPQAQGAVSKWIDGIFGGGKEPDPVRGTVKELGGTAEPEKGAVNKGVVKDDQPNFNPNKPETWGRRGDNTQKGTGFLGRLPIPGTHNIATEMSIGVELEGKEIELPLLVPTLTKNEIDYLLTHNGEPTKAIESKAIDHARMRIEQGKSPFAQPGEGPESPLIGKPAGRYRVNGREIKWDGSKEL